MSKTTKEQTPTMLMTIRETTIKGGSLIEDNNRPTREGNPRTLSPMKSGKRKREDDMTIGSL
jgi:hypothetical protein